MRKILPLAVVLVGCRHRLSATTDGVADVHIRPVDGEGFTFDVVGVDAVATDTYDADLHDYDLRVVSVVDTVEAAPSDCFPDGAQLDIDVFTTVSVFAEERAAPFNAVSGWVSDVPMPSFEPTGSFSGVIELEDGGEERPCMDVPEDYFVEISWVLDESTFTEVYSQPGPLFEKPSGY